MKKFARKIIAFVDDMPRPISLCFGGLALMVPRIDYGIKDYLGIPNEKSAFIVSMAADGSQKIDVVMNLDITYDMFGLIDYDIMMKMADVGGLLIVAAWALMIVAFATYVREARRGVRHDG